MVIFVTVCDVFFPLGLQMTNGKFLNQEAGTLEVQHILPVLGWALTPPLGLFPTSSVFPSPVWSEALPRIYPTEFLPSVLLASLPQLHDYMAPATSVSPSYPTPGPSESQGGLLCQACLCPVGGKMVSELSTLSGRDCLEESKFQREGTRLAVMAVVKMQSYLSSPLVPVVLPWHGTVEEQAR